MDKTTVEILVMKPIALAVLVNFDVHPATVFLTASDVTLIPIVQMRQMKWVARNPTAL
jgi:peptidoglycan/xylan/chitin deacetylase (PgdA/CDA1 family)